MIDLHETQRIKDLLDADPENFQEIIESSSLAICITNPDGMYSSVNNKYLKLYGYSSEEMIGSSFLMVLEEHNKEKLQELHDMFMKLKDEIFRHWEVMRKDGRIFHITADAGYSPNILGLPHKVTFVWPEDEDLQQLISN
jgi:PAS domain S-box-containing protein